MPRNSKAKQAANQQRIVEGLAVGKKQTLIAEELGLHPVTVSRNLALLRDGLVSASREEFSQYVQQQVELLTKVIEEVWEGKLPPEAANSIRGLMDSIARLTGSNSPIKSIHATVKGPQLDALYLDIRQELLDLSDADKQEALSLMREFATTRKKPVIVDAMPLQPVERSLTDGDVLRTSE